MSQPRVRSMTQRRGRTVKVQLPGCGGRLPGRCRGGGVCDDGVLVAGVGPGFGGAGVVGGDVVQEVSAAVESWWASSRWYVTFRPFSPASPRRGRPEKLRADQGHDYDRLPRWLRERGICYRIARPQRRRVLTATGPSSLGGEKDRVLTVRLTPPQPRYERAPATSAASASVCSGVTCRSAASPGSLGRSM
jgi:hypothetical protein